MGLHELGEELKNIPIEAVDESLEQRFIQLFIEESDGWNTDEARSAYKHFKEQYSVLAYMANKAAQKYAEESGIERVEGSHVDTFEAGMTFAFMLLQELVDQDNFRQSMQ